MKVRVYKPAKNAMQSGQAATKHWVMEFEPGAKKVADQLMGWIGSTDTRGQVRMYFETLEEAVEHTVGVSELPLDEVLTELESEFNFCVTEEQIGMDLQEIKQAVG